METDKIKHNNLNHHDLTLSDICLTLMALMLDMAAISAKIQSGQSRPPQNVNFI